MEKIIEVWMHKKTGQLYEHLPTSLGGYALSAFDLEISNENPTPWSLWSAQQIFVFDDDDFYQPENFENLGEL